MMDEDQVMKSMILKYEMDFFDADFCRSRSNLKNRLSVDFVEYGKSGRGYRRNDTIKFLLDSPTRYIKIEDFELTALHEDIFLVHYLSIHMDDHSKALRTSIWKREEGLIKIFFHQGTRFDNPINSSHDETLPGTLYPNSIIVGEQVSDTNENDGVVKRLEENVLWLILLWLYCNCFPRDHRKET